MEKIHLQWRNISYVINTKSKRSIFKNKSSNIESKSILSNIDGTAYPGQILAIMGETGSGKTSLLSILAGRLSSNNNDHIINGQVNYYNTGGC